MYSNKILEIFKNPTNAGGLQGSNGVGKYIDVECGDIVKIYLIIDENKVIDEAQFKTMGSVGAIVASSVVCDIVVGLSVEEARNLKAGAVLEITGEYPANKLYTIDFAIKALNLALDNYFEKLEKEENGKVPKKAKKEQVIETISKTDIFENSNKQEASLSKVEQDDDNLFSDQVKQPEPMPDLFEKYFAELQKTSEIEAKHKIENKENITITKTTQETLNIKATKLVEEAKTYTPVVETKIIKDEDLPKRVETVNKEEKSSVSKAKAMFDAMFED